MRPRGGRVETGDSVAALNSIAGVTLGADGSWRWRQWRPAQPLPLPGFATPAQITFNNETGARFAPPIRVGAFPTFDAAGRAEGFTTFSAQVQPAKAETPAQLIVQAATTSAQTIRPQPTRAHRQFAGARARLVERDFGRAPQRELGTGDGFRSPIEPRP